LQSKTSELHTRIRYFLNTIAKDTIIYKEERGCSKKSFCKFNIKENAFEEHLKNSGRVSKKKVKNAMVSKIPLAFMLASDVIGLNERFEKTHSGFVFSMHGESFTVYLPKKLLELIGHYDLWLNYIVIEHPKTGRGYSIKHHVFMGILVYLLLYFNGNLNARNRSIFKKMMLCCYEYWR
jgi:hypothetical protein